MSNIYVPIGYNVILRFLFFTWPNIFYKLKMKSIEIVNLKNRNITFIPQSLIQEIGCFVKVSIYLLSI